jgi:hypothetical protein
MLWCTPIIPAFWRLRQADREFEASLGYIASKTNKRQQKTKKRKEKKA